MKQEKLNKILNEHKLWLSGNDGARADLQGANLQGADLQGANLRGANLRGANLQGANLQGANLRDANLWGAVGAAIACPEEGTFIAFKKARFKNQDVIVKLQIPDDAKRSSATGRKCRCDKALVLEISDITGIITDFTYAESSYDSNFVYKVSEIVSVNNFDETRWNECAPGIHFFITRQEAVDY